MKTLVACGLVGLAVNALGAEPEAVEIPLDEIWAYEMPETRDVRELDTERNQNQASSHPIVKRVVKSLISRRDDEAKSRTAFVVTGKGIESLRNADVSFRADKEREATIAPDLELTVVFYSMLGAPYVHIVSVERFDRTILVKYRFVEHSTRDSSVHFALIPVGKLSKGEYEVKIQQDQSVNLQGKDARRVKDAEQLLSSGFSFVVQEEKK